MKRAKTPSLISYSDQETSSYSKEKEEEEESEGFLKNVRGRRRNANDEDEEGEFGDRVTCMTLRSKRRHHSRKKVEQISVDQYGLWRQEQKSGAAMLQKQLKNRWTLEDLIDKQLKHFHAHYNQAMILTHLEDVARILMPKWTPPLEMASVSWLGDWRPSAILKLLQSLARSCYLSSSLRDSTETEKIISQLIRETCIEEAILEAEMAEIQSTCILHLPFGQANEASTSPLACVQSELKKIKQVIIKGQQLRFKVLELIVKKVLSQVDAAEFLVAFAGIQDAVHQFASRQIAQKGIVTVSMKALGNV